VDFAKIAEVLSLSIGRSTDLIRTIIITFLVVFVVYLIPKILRVNNGNEMKWTSDAINWQKSIKCQYTSITVKTSTKD
jgi:hypothetical protein